ncbi:MAG TPA: AAA family ATPase [Solirubrobacterales bacterium]|nr:AAA family ATPase [Solirubrobacterales bacterium]
MLIGRELERAALAPVLATAASGSGGLVLVAGEAGVGKTRLVRAVLAESGLRVLASGAGAPGGTTPYAPLVAALRDHLRSDPEGLRSTGPLAPCLALLLPELGPPPAPCDHPTLVEALRGALAAIGREQPTAVFLDDLHWADAATLELLPALASGLSAEPLAVIGAYRSDDLTRGHPLRRARTELRRDGRLREVSVGPLDVAETGLLAGRILGRTPSPRLVAVLHDRTQGLPFFVEELAAGLDESGRLHEGSDGLALADEAELPLPDTLRDAILLRADGLSDAGRDALEATAVVGVQVDLDLAEGLVGTAAGLTELIERGLLLEAGGGRAIFRHALTREVVYSEVPWPRRRALHRRVAADLEASGAPAAVVAEHWLAGREFEPARRALLAAATGSCAVHAYRDAAQALRRALELWPEDGEESGRLAALDQLGSCAQLAGDTAGAVRAWAEAAAGYRAAGEVAALAAAERHLAGALELQGTWERALAARRSAAESFVAASMPAEAAAERLALAAHLKDAARFTEALPLLTEVTGEAEQSGRIDLMARALGLDGSVRANLGETEAGLALVRRGLDLALEHDLAGAAAEAYYWLAEILEHAADYGAAREAYGEAYAFCEARNLPEMGQTCLACLGWVLWSTGEWDRAVTLCEEIRAASDVPPSAVGLAAELLGHVYAARGDVKRGRPLLLEGLAWGKRFEYASTEFGCTWMLARIDILQGAAESAVTRSMAALARWAETEDRYYAVQYLRWSATFLADQGRPADVAACASALARIAAGAGTPDALAALAHALGEAALLDGDAPRAVNNFTRALELLRGVDLPYERAQVQLRAGVALAAIGEREAGVERLTDAYRSASKLRARPLADRAVQELAALGEQVDRRLGRRAAGRLERAGLTPRELEAVRLAAAGWSNRDIGRELFLSERTVEMHVGNALAKLGCRSRGEAARKAEEMGLLA